MTQHAIKRAKERYGVDFDLSDMLEIARLVRLGLCSDIADYRKDPNARAVNVFYQGRHFRLIIDLRTFAIVTFLGPRWSPGKLAKLKRRHHHHRGVR